MLQSKLDDLARKEDELRRINDELDIKKKKIMSGADKLEESKGNDEDDAEDSDNSFDQFKGKNLAQMAGKRGGANAAVEDEEEEEDDYGDGNFENQPEEAKRDSHGAGAADPYNFQMKMDDDDDIAATVAAGRRAQAAASMGADNSDDEL